MGLAASRNTQHHQAEDDGPIGAWFLCCANPISHLLPLLQRNVKHVKPNPIAAALDRHSFSSASNVDGAVCIRVACLSAALKHGAVKLENASIAADVREQAKRSA
jgi:hypothetical protein